MCRTTCVGVNRTRDVSPLTRLPPKTATNMCPLSFRCTSERPSLLLVSYPFFRGLNIALTLVLILIGVKVRSDGVAQARVYFCLEPRATLVGRYPMLPIASYVDELGVSQLWERLMTFIRSLSPSDRVSDPPILALGTAPIKKNAAKVY
jgi:hypothetical protein